MPFYKDEMNKVHYLEHEGLEHLLPKGCMLITEGDARQLSAPSREQIRDLRVSEIDVALSEIEKKKVRAITDALLTNDKTRLADLEDQSDRLRQERRTLAQR